jgi:two-component system nitrogen regulation response regulator NtrX
MNKKPDILIIDDDKAIIDSLSSLFKDNACNPVGAQTGHAAFELATSSLFDLIILDLGLPDIEGMELLKMLKAAGVAAPIIIVSGQATLKNAVEATRLGAFNVIEKPPDPAQLILDSQIALKQRALESEIALLRQSLLRQNDMIGESTPMQALREKIRRIAASDSRVYIGGEPGAGKEIAARYLHFSSARATGPFEAVNCAAIPRELFESEFFGHEKGAFTGAIAARKGRFESADGGTLFLDEVTELRPDHQAKLLRAIESSVVQRLGSSREVRIDVRIVSASNKEMQAETRAGRFREDLYFRLNVIPISVPPLRERLGDIPLLARHFLDTLGYGHLSLDSSAISILSAYNWPGNVRELKNIMERTAALKYGDLITGADIGESLSGGKMEMEKLKYGPPPRPMSLKEHAARFEKSLLQEVLRQAEGNITRAASLLRMDRGNLSKKLKKHGLKANE